MRFSYPGHPVLPYALFALHVVLLAGTAYVVSIKLDEGDPWSALLMTGCGLFVLVDTIADVRAWLAHRRPQS